MKRSAGLRALSSEHHTALVAARRATLAVSGDEVADAWRVVALFFEAELAPHFLREETLLLPALAQAGESALVLRTLAEHAQLRTLACDRARDSDTLQLFAALLQAHIRFEERELFESAQSHLPEFSLAEPS